jgi:hypothetical protein
MSGYLPGASKFKITPGFEGVPVMHCHGTADPVVIFDHVEKTRNHVTEKGLRSYNVRSYNGVGHTITPEILKDVAIFFKQILPFNIDLCIKPKLPKDMSVKEVYTCIYIYKYIYIYIYVCIFINVYINIYLYTCVNI